MRGVTSRDRGGILIGAGAGLAIVVALLVLQEVTFGGFGVTSIVTTTQQATDVVGASFANHMLLIGSGNVSAIVNQYERNATVTWKGNANGRQGTYTNTRDLGNLLEDGFGTGANSFVIGNVTQLIAAK